MISLLSIYLILIQSLTLPDVLHCSGLGWSWFSPDFHFSVQLRTSQSEYQCQRGVGFYKAGGSILELVFSLALSLCLVLDVQLEHSFLRCPISLSLQTSLRRVKCPEYACPLIHNAPPSHPSVDYSGFQVLFSEIMSVFVLDHDIEATEHYLIQVVH